MAKPITAQSSLCRILPPIQLGKARGSSRAIPSLHPQCPSSAFATTALQCKRRTSDNNPNRGVSSIHRSGPRQMLSMSDEPLPRPSNYRPKIKVDPNHGLWGFFPKPFNLMRTPEEDSQHGRAWTMQELRKKSWDDLHRLWWVCVRERNVIATAKVERSRARLGFGDSEAQERDLEVRKTMKAIKHTLTERFYTWEDARQLAKTDPEINLSGYGPAYRPSDYYEPEDDAVSSDASQGSESVQMNTLSTAEEGKGREPDVEEGGEGATSRDTKYDKSMPLS